MLYRAPKSKYRIRALAICGWSRIMFYSYGYGVKA